MQSTNHVSQQYTIPQYSKSRISEIITIYDPISYISFMCHAKEIEQQFKLYSEKRSQPLIFCFCKTIKTEILDTNHYIITAMIHYSRQSDIIVFDNYFVLLAQRQPQISREDSANRTCPACFLLMYKLPEIACSSKPNSLKTVPRLKEKIFIPS